MSVTTFDLASDTAKNKTFTASEIFILSILACMQFTFLVDYIIIMPLGPEVMTALSIDPRKFSYLISVYTFSAAISGFLASFIIDKFERKKSLLLCYLGFSIGPILSATATDFNTLLAARVFTGAFGGVLTALIMTMVGDFISSQKIGRATSFVLSSNAVASIIGIPVALFLVNLWHWKAPFYIMSGLNMCLCIAGYFLIPVMKKHLTEIPGRIIPAQKLASTVYNPNFIWPLIFMSLLTLAGGFTILPFLSTFVNKNYGFTVNDISYLFFLGGIASFITAPLAGTLADKFGKQNIFLWLNFLSIIPIILLTIFPLDTKIITLTITTFFFMLSTGRHVSGMALINSRFDPKIRGKFISLNGSIQLFSGSAGTLLAGYLLTENDGLIENFDLLGIIAICATIICIFAAFVLEE